MYKEQVKALKGTSNLLKDLKKENVLLGLVTGNLEPIAYAKLGKVGFDDYFHSGFGSDYEDRYLLVKTAIELAKVDMGLKARKSL